MTRAEYEQKYGSIPPSATSTPKVDTTPAPIRMTREQYQRTYGVTPSGETFNDPVANVIDRKASFPADTNTSKVAPNLLRTAGNLPSSAINLVRSTVVDPIVNFAEADKALADIYKSRGPIDGTKDILGGFADTYLQVGQAIYGGLDKAFNALLDDPKGAFETVSRETAKVGIEDPLFIPTLLYGGGKGKALKTDLISDIAKPVTETTEKLAGNARPLLEIAEEVKNDVQTVLRTRNIETVADEIYAIEQNYVAGRKANRFSSDDGAGSRSRIAESGVLRGATDADGTISTLHKGGPVDAYRAGTTDKYEDLVRRGLEREGSYAEIPAIRNALVSAIDRSGLEGADLVTALRGVERELEGLSKRAETVGVNRGKIPLAKLHDSKISTTRNINFQTPPETQTYRKAVANAYKRMIEDSSSLDVKSVNERLARYYEDIERLERLNGKKVKGSRLGKYTAQITGNIAGGAAGALVGGGGGAAIGSIIGGEVSTALQSSRMKGAFGSVKNGAIPDDELLRQNSSVVRSPRPSRDLGLPDPVVGVRSGIKKTDEMIEIEGRIRNNVKKQKEAIKRKDYTLVQSLKEIYDALVSDLRKLASRLEGSGSTPEQSLQSQ